MPRAVRYRVLRKIAHGGMAEIFLALQTGAEGFQKPVVLKRILPAFAADPHFVRMLVDEAHIASSLSHSNLVQVLDLGKAGDQFFLVLEFVDGWSVEQVRRRAQKARLKFPLALAVQVVASLCRGLSYVHQRTRDGKPLGIVHRDISPQNVLLGREGEVKLADFGIAKAVGRREKSATGIIKGKFAYMSPEQSIGTALDARSDLFSVGTLLYILTTGRKPFDAPTDLEVLMQVRRARYEKPSALVKDFNADVERFIARALRADRSRRWQSAEQMADRLDAILVKLGQAGGPAALKRWLETLSARDGVQPPGDVREPEIEASVGTIELETGDLELPDTASGEIAESLPRAARGNDSASISSVSYLSFSIAPGSAPVAAHEAPTRRAPLFAVLGVPATPEPELDGDDDLPIYEEEAMAPGAALTAVGADAEPSTMDATQLEPEPDGLMPHAPTAGDTMVADEPRDEEPLDGPPDASRTPTPARTPAPLRLVQGVGRLLLTLMVVATLGGGVYLARRYSPPWLVARVVAPVDAWLRHLPSRLRVGLERKPAAPAPTGAP